MRNLTLLLLLSVVGCQKTTEPAKSEPPRTAPAQETLSHHRSDAQPVAANQFEAKLIHVVDGDTCDVLTDDKKTIRIRLHGIDSPERGQPYGRNATNALKAYAGERLLVVDQGSGGFNRRAADLYAVDDDATGVVETINLKLVRAGWAWWSSKYSQDTRLRDAQQEARKAKRGLWAAEDGRVPVNPSEWRKLSKEEMDKLR